MAGKACFLSLSLDVFPPEDAHFSIWSARLAERERGWLMVDHLFDTMLDGPRVRDKAGPACKTKRTKPKPKPKSKPNPTNEISALA